MSFLDLDLRVLCLRFAFGDPFVFVHATLRTLQPALLPFLEMVDEAVGLVGTHHDRVVRSLREALQAGQQVLPGYLQQQQRHLSGYSAVLMRAGPVNAAAGLHCFWCCMGCKRQPDRLPFTMKRFWRLLHSFNHDPTCRLERFCQAWTTRDLIRGAAGGFFCLMSDPA